jgi:hypothetical protein
VVPNTQCSSSTACRGRALVVLVVLASKALVVLVVRARADAPKTSGNVM